jgi:hypothetical protein
MLTRAARNKVERILEHISKQERKSCWSGTSADADALRLAWYTVWFAAYQESPLPFDAALRKVLGPRYTKQVHARKVVPAIYCGVDVNEPYEVNGRNASQWVRSVLSYLDWRSGDAWRPMSERNCAERRIYTDASLELRHAFYSTPNRPPAAPKKQLAAAQQASSHKRSA